MKFPEKKPDKTRLDVDKSGVRINKNLAKALYIILGVVTIALLIMTIFASASGKNADYPAMTAVIFILLGGAIAVSLVVFNPQKSIYDIGFYLLHMGIVLFLVGMAVFAVKGSSHYVALPDIASVIATEKELKNNYSFGDSDIDRLKSYRNQMAGDDGEIIDLGFNFRITDFTAEYYEDGEAVKHYDAEVEFFLRDGTVETLHLTVNHPIYRGGWKIYLMSVGTSPYGYEQVTLLIKNDPAEFVSVAGIALIILGTFMMCLLPENLKISRKDGKKRGVIANG